MKPPSVATLNVLEEVAKERTRQDQLWGGPDHDDQHGPADWFDMILEHIEVPRVGEKPGYRTEMVQAAALIVAAIEAYDREQARENSPVASEPEWDLADIPF